MLQAFRQSSFRLIDFQSGLDGSPPSTLSNLLRARPSPPSPPPSAPLIPKLGHLSSRKRVLFSVSKIVFVDAFRRSSLIATTVQKQAAFNQLCSIRCAIYILCIRKTSVSHGETRTSLSVHLNVGGEIWRPRTLERSFVKFQRDYKTPRHQNDYSSLKMLRVNGCTHVPRARAFVR